MLCTLVISCNFEIHTLTLPSPQPSGSGKTTLLNVLAGRIKNGGKKKLSGDVLANGERISPVAFRKQVAYVTQEDALFATQTVG
jgi:ATP-binding cassette subfamily G (WHITE) protein 2